MQKFLPKKIPDTNNFTHEWNKLVDWCVRKTIYNSSDILVTETTKGTTLTLADKIKPTPATIGSGSAGGLDWAGVYNESSSYSVNDLVYVDFKHSYSVPFIAASGSTQPPLVAGVFLCINNIPSSGSRNAYNYYYPICPTIPSASQVTVSGSVANQTFWQPINPLQEMSVCIGGQASQNYWIGSFPTSDFDLSKLPYHA